MGHETSEPLFDTRCGKSSRELCAHNCTCLSLTVSHGLLLGLRNGLLVFQIVKDASLSRLCSIHTMLEVLDNREGRMLIGLLGGTTRCHQLRHFSSREGEVMLCQHMLVHGNDVSRHTFGAERAEQGWRLLGRS
jgi:hypothetical protein